VLLVPLHTAVQKEPHPLPAPDIAGVLL
jgi:hypothetical protein